MARINLVQTSESAEAGGGRVRGYLLELRQVPGGRFRRGGRALPANDDSRAGRRGADEVPLDLLSGNF